MDNFNYTFPAVRGIQNDRAFYQATVPFRALASMLKLDDCFDVNKRSQRIVNAPRAKKVAEYISANRDGFYVIPPLVGFIDGDFSFDEVPLDGFINVGNMKVPIDLKIMLFDGQHRAYGIRQLMETDRDLSSQSVSIMFFEGMTLAQRKQAFHDINHTQKAPATALCIAYNERSGFDKMVVEVFSKSILRGHIEYEKNSVSGDNENLYSLKAIKDFAVNLLDKDVSEDSAELLANVVDTLFGTINPMGQASEILGGAKAFRSESIVGHAVTLKALGLFARSMINQYPTDWGQKLAKMKRPSFFMRGSDKWAGRCVTEDDKMISNKHAVELTLIQMLKEVGRPLDVDLQRVEAEFSARASEVAA